MVWSFSCNFEGRSQLYKLFSNHFTLICNTVSMYFFHFFNIWLLPIYIYIYISGKDGIWVCHYMKIDLNMEQIISDFPSLKSNWETRRWQENTRKRNRNAHQSVWWCRITELAIEARRKHRVIKNFNFWKIMKMIIHS